jgi:hypothetical protein
MLSDLNLHMYRIQILQQLNASDREVRLKYYHQLVKLLIGNSKLLLLVTDETHFHFNELLINIILDTGLIITHMNFINVPFTAQK